MREQLNAIRYFLLYMQPMIEYGEFKNKPSALRYFNDADKALTELEEALAIVERRCQ